VRSTYELLGDIDRLVNVWCDRRCLSALRRILQGWPLTSRLTDDWANLLDALEKVRAFAKDELTDDEQTRLEEAIQEVARVVYRT
jgi:hypothetical protein